MPDDKIFYRQQVEHAFRDLKSDNISIRPVYHRNTAQTKGHVQVCIFAYAIIKEMENRLFEQFLGKVQNSKKQFFTNCLRLKSL